jgi:hypothetical protein
MILLETCFIFELKKQILHIWTYMGYLRRNMEIINFEIFLEITKCQVIFETLIPPLILKCDFNEDILIAIIEWTC